MKERIVGALREIALVAVGVWLAFSVDSCADERSDRRDELRYLDGLRTEFAQAEERLSNAVTAQSDGLAQLEWLLARVHDSAAPIPDDSISNALWAGYVTQFFTPPDAVYSDLIQSGRLDLIESDSLRYLLGRWESGMEFHALMKSKELDGYATVTSRLAIEDIPLRAMRDEFRGIRLVGDDVDLDEAVRREQVLRSIELRMLDSVDLRMAFARLQPIAAAIRRRIDDIVEERGGAS